MLNDEIKYKKLRESLRALPKIKARGDFEARLYRKIREHESRTVPEPAARNSIWDVLANLLKPSLAPAIGLTVILLISVVVYFAYFNQMKKDTQPISTSNGEKKGEFVIYVHKEGERVNEEPSGDISSNDLRQPGTMYSPSERSTDGYVPPVETPKTETRDKEDRLSREQELKMEKVPEPSKDMDDSKSVPKLEERKIMKKGFEDEVDRAPSNIRKEDTSGKTEGEQNQTISPQNDNGIEQKQVDEKNAEEKRISRNKSDSLKAKNKKAEEQKDSMEK